jgi:hypothetical protein
MRRVALWLGAVSIFAMSIVGASTATAATPAASPKATVTVEAVPANGFSVQSNCPITSYYLHQGAYICETQGVRIAWFFQGVLTNVDDIVIGTDWRIYHDAGPGWSWLGGGVASSTANAPGIFIESNNTIGVVGTDGNSWCNTTTLPGTWAGWRRC